MRSILLAMALLLATVAVLLAVSAGHTKNGPAEAVAAEQQQEQQKQPQPQQTPADGVRRVTVKELRAALDKGAAVVVDVRSVEAFRMGHIKGALSIPGAEVASRIKELPKDKLIVTYCS